jgi:hypothetical protein
MQERRALGVFREARRARKLRRAERQLAAQAILQAIYLEYEPMVAAAVLDWLLWGKPLSVRAFQARVNAAVQD